MDNNYNNNQNGYQQDGQFQQDKYPQQSYPQQSYPQQNYQQGTYQQTNYQQGMYQQDMYQNSYNQPNLQELDNKATMAMVFGIIGIFFAGIIFGILALVNANACKKAGYSNGKVTAGFVLGIIDLVALALYVVFVFAMLGGAIAASM